MPSQIRLITTLSSGGIPINPTYWLVFAFSITILPTLHAEKIDNRNFAIDTCFPTPHEFSWLRDEREHTGQNTPCALEQNLSFWLSRFRRFSRARFKIRSSKDVCASCGFGRSQSWSWSASCRSP